LRTPKNGAAQVGAKARP